MAGRLTKATSVMDYFDDEDNDSPFVSFHTMVDEGELGASVTRTVLLAQQDWDDMGRPLEVTVTIEPGNTIDQGNGIEGHKVVGSLDIASAASYRDEHRQGVIVDNGTPPATFVLDDPNGSR